MTAALEKYRPLFMVITFGFLGMAFYMTYRPGRVTKVTGIVRFNRALLWVVTLAAGVALFCPQYLTGPLTADGGFTPQMQQTVLKVEGMTCPG